MSLNEVIQMCMEACVLAYFGEYNHWTGLLDWTTA